MTDSATRPRIEEPVPASGRPPGLAERLVVAAFSLAALALRVVPTFRFVVSDGDVWFRGADAWYHVRLAEAWIAGFPHRLRYDPAVHFPSGGPVEVAPLMDLLMALPGALLPISQHSSRVWMALLPALLGGLGVVLVWGWARSLFGRSVGLLAAALLLVDPGAYLQRSMLGHADHHVLEAVLALGVLVALTRTFGRPEADGETAGPLAAWPRGSLLAGLMLALYLTAWSSGAFLVAVLVVWGAGQELLAREPRERVAGMLAATLAVALVVVGLGFGDAGRRGLQVVALGGGCATLLIALAVDSLRSRRGWTLLRSRVVLAAAWGTLALGSSLALARWDPGLTEQISSQSRRLLGGAFAGTVVEARPLLLIGDQLSWRPAWWLHRALFVFGVGMLVVLGARWLRARSAALGLLVVWGSTMLVATLMLVRFDYYLSPALAVTAAAGAERLLGLATSAARGGGAAGRRVYRSLAWLAVVTLLYVPASLGALRPALADRTPSAGWRQALVWLRENTPEPFADSGWLENPVPRLRAGQEPPPARSCVFSWWDFGYHILTVGRRVPFANPTQWGAGEAAAIFLETDERRASASLRREGVGQVLTDSRFAPALLPGGGLALGYFESMVKLAGLDLSRFVGSVVERGLDGAETATLYFTEEFYRTLVVRLTHLGVGRVTAAGPVGVVTLGPGEASAVLVRFGSREEAVAALDEGAVRGRLVGLTPFLSPWDLPEVPDLEPVAVFGPERVVVHRLRARTQERVVARAGALPARGSVGTVAAPSSRAPSADIVAARDATGARRHAGNGDVPSRER